MMIQHNITIHCPFKWWYDGVVIILTCVDFFTHRSHTISSPRVWQTNLLSQYFRLFLLFTQWTRQWIKVFNFGHVTLLCYAKSINHDRVEHRWDITLECKINLIGKYGTWSSRQSAVLCKVESYVSKRRQQMQCGILLLIYKRTWER